VKKTRREKSRLRIRVRSKLATAQFTHFFAHKPDGAQFASDYARLGHGAFQRCNQGAQNVGTGSKQHLQILLNIIASFLINQLCNSDAVSSGSPTILELNRYGFLKHFPLFLRFNACISNKSSNLKPRIYVSCEF